MQSAVTTSSHKQGPTDTTNISEILSFSDTKEWANKFDKAKRARLSVVVTPKTFFPDVLKQRPFVG